VVFVVVVVLHGAVAVALFVVLVHPVVILVTIEFEVVVLNSVMLETEHFERANLTNLISLMLAGSSVPLITRVFVELSKSYD